MTENQRVQTHIDGEIKKEAAAVLADHLIPNATTIAAMKEARAGNLRCVSSIEELKKSLYAESRARGQRRQALK